MEKPIEPKPVVKPVKEYGKQDKNKFKAPTRPKQVNVKPRGRG